MDSLGLYVHWPFCIVKCPYCDFNSHKVTNHNEVQWLNAYLSQIDFFDNFLANNYIKKNKLSSIFFGGGTPSLMKPYFVEKIISKAFDVFGFKKQIEITLEANPSTIEFQNIRDFKNAGINRISLGVQSLNDIDLKFLGRIHKFSDIKETLEIVLKNFKNTSIDLIYGLQNQKLFTWEKQLNQFLSDFNLKHISAYQLTIEKGTKFYKLYNENNLTLLSEKKQMLFYEVTKNIIENHNFSQYEISNFSKNKFKSVHNQIYWRSENWLGIGPGAISRIWDRNYKRYEFENFKKPSSWLKNILFNENKLKKIEALDDKITDQEILMMGLRLTNGIELNRLNNKDFIKNKYINFLLKKSVMKIKDKKILVHRKHLIKLNTILDRIINNW